MSGIAGTLEVVKDADALAARAAEIIAGRLQGARAIPFAWCCRADRRRAPTYELLADKEIDWDCAELFFGDERFVPPDHQDSNYRMVRETLLSSGVRQSAQAAGHPHRRHAAKRRRPL